jgi:hypothetical protein
LAANEQRDSRVLDSVHAFIDPLLCREALNVEASDALGGAGKKRRLWRSVDQQVVKLDILVVQRRRKTPLPASSDKEGDADATRNSHSLLWSDKAREVRAVQAWIC